MIYIYNDYGGTHTSIMAAAYHIGKLDETREPKGEELLSLPYFNTLDYSDRGRLFHHGTDEEGNPVYTVARGRSKVMVPAMCSLIRMLQDGGKLDTGIIFSNTSPTVPIPMTIGGFLSRGLKIDSLGVPLILWGTRINYRQIIRLVHKTKEAARNADTGLVVLDNREIGHLFS